MVAPSVTMWICYRILAIIVQESNHQDPPLEPKLCPKIILEGTRLTFKTEIAFALNELPLISTFQFFRQIELPAGQNEQK